ncbi:hypothetical protein [Dyella sp.]|uniref:hypothetical protein n=1 Tax=Dyella sp. TaxID=1869338 RepID=UPI002ED035E7
MSRQSAHFPLEPLRTVRGIRLHALESEMKRCRECHAQAQHQWDEAEDALMLARQVREDFAVRSWAALFESGVPTALAMDRHERHLALLDHTIVQRHIERDARAATCEEARQAAELAAQAWRLARNKLDAVDEMKQGWLRDVRGHEERREEHNLEELLLRQRSH